MARINHQSNFATNLTSNTAASDTTSPLNAIPSIDAPFYLAFDATNINGHYEVKACTSKTATNVNHTALSYAHTTAEEVRLVIPAEEMNNLGTLVDQVDGAWVSWTPTWTNLTVGNGTLLSKYTQIGKKVSFRIEFTLGSTSSIGGSVRFTLPVTTATYEITSTYNPIGFATLMDTGTNSFDGNIVTYSTTEAIIRCKKSDGTYVVQFPISNTVPFTWTTGDIILMQGTYEAA